jgi:hypothetical protein
MRTPDVEGDVAVGCFVGLLLAVVLWAAIAWLVRIVFFAR